ncbi:hypothetical protein C7974DRAFT_211729 [Boeremia exigua]|uniref:uncharacterized protein n=1 Tax=Boeremia exigua TaxID=749465 RepID=UPI001E8EB096|nr:uncharacterized protein C7974DRAFT_211729 [Boeremia exigua]KAH6621833.1 hypothetical protein C7974DRAFT_211729 [Boeremia exigua]
MTSKPHIGFLDLPAEIRNEIYAFLIEDVDTNVGHKTIRLRPRTEFSSHWRRKNPHRGEVYALNQVCRATRREFGPLYVAQITHRLRVDEQLLPLFLHDFFLSKEVECNFALKPQKIEIELPYPLGGKLLRLDILPLLTFCLGNEDIQCSFLNKFGPMPELNALFWDHAVAWGEAILDDLSKILVHTPSGTTTVVDLFFRGDSQHAFISDIKRPGQRVPDSMHGYLRALGRATWDPRVGVWNPHGRIEFVVSRGPSLIASEKSKGSNKVFQTQYRLVED